MLLSVESALPLTKAAREFFPPGRLGLPVHLSTLTRWIHKGVRAQNGERVRLGCLRIGGQIFIRAEDAEQFLRALNADSQAVAEHDDADFARRAKEDGEALAAMGC